VPAIPVAAFSAAMDTVAVLLLPLLLLLLVKPSPPAAKEEEERSTRDTPKSVILSCATLKYLVGVQKPGRDGKGETIMMMIKS
jgi:hypothetical protein